MGDSGLIITRIAFNSMNILATGIWEYLRASKTERYIYLHVLL